MTLIFPELSPDVRAKRYRALVYKARRGAERATGAARDSFVSIERQWEQLALEAEADAMGNWEISRTS